MAATLALAGCGGGTSAVTPIPVAPASPAPPATQSLHGYVAVGRPVAGAGLTLKCANGKTYTTASDGTGAYAARGRRGRSAVRVREQRRHRRRRGVRGQAALDRPRGRRRERHPADRALGRGLRQIVRRELFRRLVRRRGLGPADRASAAIGASAPDRQPAGARADRAGGRLLQRRVHAGRQRRLRHAAARDRGPDRGGAPAPGGQRHRRRRRQVPRRRREPAPSAQHGRDVEHQRHQDQPAHAAR